MYAHAIAQVEPPDVGIHLIWTGPSQWVYSQKGWSIQRRKFQGRDEEAECLQLDKADIANLRVTRELLWTFGILSLRNGIWPASILPGSNPNTFDCEVFRLELSEPQRKIRVNVAAKLAFAFALRDENVVASSATKSGNVFFELSAIAIDTVVVYVLEPDFISFCTLHPFAGDNASWQNAPFIVQGLQIPIQELMPGLNDFNDEFAEAKSRLLPGEDLDPEEFRRLADTLRTGIKQVGPARPLDVILLTREDLSANFEELAAVDPLRVLLSHPKWRRVLGFGWFDNDPALQPGVAYEYRITGHFQLEDLHDTVYGFHSVPSQTLLPAEFFLNDLRLRLSQPVVVQRAPKTDTTGSLQTTRRGIRLQPRDKPWWVLSHIQLDDSSLVIDFPTAIAEVMLELHQEHQLEWFAFASGTLVASDAVPPGSNVLIQFPQPIDQLRLLGEGFLFAIRILSGLSGVKELPVDLPPVILNNTPRPQPPLWAAIENLQQPQSQPQANDMPPATPQRRPALGFEVVWRPVLRDNLQEWPADADTAPPLDAAIFQIEHRQETSTTILAAESLAALRTTAATGARAGATRSSARPRLLQRIQASQLPAAERDRLVNALATEDQQVIAALTLADDAAWTPVLPDENWVMGDRKINEVPRRVRQGANLLEIFPEVPERGTGDALDLRWRDVFDFKAGGNEVIRPVPPPGTYHRYRVRTIDAIGRPSELWTETNQLRLEKHIPPPVPAGPDLTPAEDRDVPAPTGVQARVLVQGAPSLTPDDLALLGADSNVIVLRWGWHASQREQDEYATEFRVYATSQPMDVIAGTITAFTAISLGVYDVSIQLARAVVEDAAAGLTLDAPYPFQIYSHTAGTAITCTVGTRVPKPDGSFHEPVTGPINFNVPLTPDLMRPPAWDARVEVQAITPDVSYTAILRNRLTLTPEHPRDAIWVGVSAADAQSYVPDQLAPVETRAGNESAIVPVLCEARYHGRPVFEVPPALDPVPAIIAPEPAGGNVSFSLNLMPHFDSSGFGPGERMQPERLAAEQVFTSYYATAGNQVMARVIDARNAGETDQEVIVPNPDDRAAIIDALNGASVDALADHYVVFLAGSHPYRDRLFVPTSDNPVTLGAFTETLPPRGERYVYRIRKADAAGHLSAGGAMAVAIVRVPSLLAGPTPVRIAKQQGDPPEMLRLRVGPDERVHHLLTFARVVNVAALNGTPSAEGASLVRVPNRPDLYPNDGIRLRTPDGAYLTPTVKALTDSDVTVDAHGFRELALQFTVNPGQRVQVWSCALTVDGVPSLLAGPWGLTAPAPPLPVPSLAVTQVASELLFTWTWPSPDGFHDISKLEVALSQSADGSDWTRFSPLLAGSTTSYVYTPPAGAWQYRISVLHPNGQSAHGTVVTP